MNSLYLNKKEEQKKKKNGFKKILLMFLKNIVVTVIIIIGLVFLIGVYFFLFPKYKEIQAMANIDFQDQETKYQAKAKELAEIKKIKSDYREILPEDLDKINFIFPSEPDQKELFGYIDKMLSRNGYILPSLSIVVDGNSPALGPKIGSDGTAGESNLRDNGIGVITIGFTISGVNYAGLKSLLNQIENDLRLFDIVKLEYNPAGSLSLVMNTYYRLGK
jgi:hypothetical protein